MSNENISIKIAGMVLLGDMLFNEGKLTNTLIQMALKQPEGTQEKRIITAKRVP